MPECQCCCEQEMSEQDLLDKLDPILDEYALKPGGLIPVLQIAQNMMGYLPKSALKKISLKFNKPYSEVAGVVSFYSFFSTVPRGKYIIRVCLGTACYVRGGKDVLDSLKKELGIDVGGTTENRMFSLEIGRCFGACGLAPVIMVNDEVIQRAKPSKMSELIASYVQNEQKIQEAAQ
jgi:NADH:ubiquinone oxidoreductase subunit E